LKRFPVEIEVTQRLAPLSQLLGRTLSPILVSYRYFNPGIFLANPDEDMQNAGVPMMTPILVMGWVEGISLGKHLQKLCRLGDAAALVQLLERWLMLIREMRRIGLAHGDITASNIMVRSNDGALVLVDYDDLYLPGLDDANRKVMGTPGYQHPKLKGARSYGPGMDDFSLLVMTVSLAVLAEQPDKFGSTDQPLFKKMDLSNTNSDAFNVARNVWDGNAQEYVRMLEEACNAAPDALVDFDRIVFADQISKFEAAIDQCNRSALQAQAPLIRNLSVWPQYASDYEDIAGRSREKGLEMLRFAIASKNAVWVREMLKLPHVDMSLLEVSERSQLDALLR
ncbi:MAG: hypothetical protein NTZ50_16635, partial [Chloroflexi bacterium]|nr:hypothetical protein [Chloroflexota bacterium]